MGYPERLNLGTRYEFCKQGIEIKLGSLPDGWIGDRNDQKCSEVEKVNIKSPAIKVLKFLLEFHGI